MPSQAPSATVSPTESPLPQQDEFKTNYTVNVGSTVTVKFGDEKPESVKAANAAAKTLVKISRNKVSAMRAGTAKLRVVYKGKTYAVTVKVRKPTVTLKAVKNAKLSAKYTKQYRKKLSVYTVKPDYKKTLDKKQVKSCKVTYQYNGKKWKMNVNKIRSFDYIIKKIRYTVTVTMKNGAKIKAKKLKVKF